MSNEPFDIYSRFDYSSFLAFALQLATISKKASGAINPETLKRIAVSRAYYAAFHGAKLYLDKIEGIPLSPTAEHFTVWKQFAQISPQVLDKGKKLKYWREWADYNDPDRIEPHDLDTVFRAIGAIQIALQVRCLERHKDSALCWLIDAKITTPQLG